MATIKSAGQYDADRMGPSNLPDAYLTIRAQITLVPVPVFKRTNLREFKVSRTSGRKAVAAPQKVCARSAFLRFVAPGQFVHCHRIFFYTAVFGVPRLQQIAPIASAADEKGASGL
jgi:hypothetical protein